MADPIAVQPPGVAMARFFRAEPLQPVDPLEHAAALHFERLRVEVFDGLQVQFGVDDAEPCHSRALTQLHLLASKGPEQLKSVCFGLMYAFLAVSWDTPTGLGFFDYLALVHALDAPAVAVRLLVALARRYHQLEELVAKRLLAILSEMLEARWRDVDLVLLALQREALPGGPGGDLALALLELCKVHVASLAEPPARPATPRLSFLWALRWAVAEGPWRQPAMELASELWKLAQPAVVEAGLPLLWALVGAREAPGIQPLLARAAEEIRLGGADPTSRECLDHLISHEEQAQLEFILATDGDSAQRRYLSWFSSRHFDVGNTSNGSRSTHLGDIILWAFGAASPELAAGRRDLWAALWRRALELRSDDQKPSAGQAGLAFVFAACCSAAAQKVLPTLLRRDEDSAEWLRTLTRAALPPEAASEALQALDAA